jgi:hypothetical protein
VNANGLARNYKFLTPEERFSLLANAGARGDEGEQQRLIAAAKRITLSMLDCGPFSQAFADTGWVTYADLLDTAAEVLERFAAVDASALPTDEDMGDEDDETDDDGPWPVGEDEASDGLPEYARLLNMAYVAGFMLNTKAAGWRLFCRRLNVPPLVLFKIMPGFARFERASKLAEVAAFKPEGVVRWLNTVRPDRDPPVTLANVITADGYAEDSERVYRERVKFWGG